jgi:hypothetical protein
LLNIGGVPNPRRSGAGARWCGKRGTACQKLQAGQTLRSMVFVVDAVTCKPVSGPEIPANREGIREFV